MLSDRAEQERRVKKRSEMNDLTVGEARLYDWNVKSVGEEEHWKDLVSDRIECTMLDCVL